MSSSQGSRVPVWLLAVGAVAVLAVAGVVTWLVWPRPMMSDEPATSGIVRPLSGPLMMTSRRGMICCSLPGFA